MVVKRVDYLMGWLIWSFVMFHFTGVRALVDLHTAVEICGIWQALSPLRQRSR